MSRRLARVAALLLATGIPLTSAHGQDAVRLQHVLADVGFELFVDSSPSPVCWHYWNWEAEGPELPVLDETFAIEVEPCTSSWTIHADADSLAWRGWWAEIDPDNYIWNFIEQDARLECRVYVGEPTRLLASRSVAGVLATDVHTVEIVPPDADPIVMLAEGTGPDEAELEVEAGLYTIILTATSLEHGTHYAQDARVHVTWEPLDGTATRPLAWSTVKARYR